MDFATHPLRSVLYIPASNERALDKARSLPTDAIIFDLEDAVAPDAKAAARATLAKALQQGGYGKRAKIIRINALTTEWGLEDVRALRDAGADAILLPKVNTASDVDNLADLLGPDMPIWTMMETPMCVFNAREIAAHRQVEGLVTGTNDLIKDLGSRMRAARLPLMLALQNIRVCRLGPGPRNLNGESGWSIHDNCVAFGDRKWPNSLAGSTEANPAGAGSAGLQLLPDVCPSTRVHELIGLSGVN